MLKFIRRVNQQRPKLKKLHTTKTLKVLDTVAGKGMRKLLMLMGESQNCPRFVMCLDPDNLSGFRTIIYALLSGSRTINGRSTLKNDIHLVLPSFSNFVTTVHFLKIPFRMNATHAEGGIQPV
jgi:hypothetical protein